MIVVSDLILSNLITILQVANNLVTISQVANMWLDFIYVQLKLFLGTDAFGAFFEIFSLILSLLLPAWFPGASASIYMYAVLIVS